MVNFASAVGTVTRLRTGWSEVQIPVRERDFLFSKASKPALGVTQPPIWWVPGFFSWG
jgi:hypothetical protein